MITCPKCGHRFARPGAVRTCARCKEPVLRRHKWKFRPDGRIEHRNCKHPVFYEHYRGPK